MGALQQGQFVSSGSIVTSTCGRWMGSAPRLARRFATRPCGHWVLLVVGRLVAGNRLFNILECQKQLLGIELLRTPAELRTLQLAQQMPQAINLRKGMIALYDRGVTLRTRRRDQHMQRIDIRRKLCDLAHARH
jgi:hypothetical protein